MFRRNRYGSCAFDLGCDGLTHCVPPQVRSLPQATIGKSNSNPWQANSVDTSCSAPQENFESGGSVYQGPSLSTFVKLKAFRMPDRSRFLA